MDAHAFLDRVLARVPARTPTSYNFESWRQGDQPTKEGLGLLPMRDVDPDKFIACVMDVDHYVGSVDHVIECHAIADDRYAPPKTVRFYQKINVPMVSKLQVELVLEDVGERDGFRVALWYQLDSETTALNPKVAARGDYNVGCWLVRPDLAGYALASAPVRKDVGLVKFKALTKGADAVAPKVFKGNLEGMGVWSRRRR
jgi:hypothetical protein